MADTKISGLTELTVPPDPTDELVVVDKSDTTMAATGTDKRIQYSNLYDWAEAGDLSTIQPDDAAAAGTSVEIPRADHKHAIVAATAGAIQPDDSAAEGTATSFARSDHKHSIATDIGVPLVGVNAEGVSTSFARADHNHQLPAVGNHFQSSRLGPEASSATGAINTYYAVRVSVPAALTLTGIRVRTGATANGNLRAALFDSTLTKVADKTASVTQQGAGNITSVPFDSTLAATPGLYYAVVWFSSATATFYGARNPSQVDTGTSSGATPTALNTPAFVSNADYPSVSTY